MANEATTLPAQVLDLAADIQQAVLDSQHLLHSIRVMREYGTYHHSTLRDLAAAALGKLAEIDRLAHLIATYPEEVTDEH